MKKYIDFNTEKGANAANSFEKDLFKLMISSVYSKSINQCYNSKQEKRLFKLY